MSWDAEPSPSPLLFGRRYRALALLGSGGMGSVYLTRDEELDELVAVKVLRPELTGNPQMIERFRDEVRMARRVSSPLVARTHDLVEHEGRWFVTMQYVEGETLAAKLRREGRMPLVDVAAVARDVCDGLAAVHAAGVVHRDLKPGNVLIATTGRAVLTDFGIALRADAAQAKTDGSGTPTYTAPEQLAGHAVDARADVFSMGAMLYVMITGKRPFADGRTGTESPPDPRQAAGDVPDMLASVVMRAMALDPRDRFASAEALRAAVDTVRPATKAPAHESRLPGFVRSLGAAEARKLCAAAIDLENITESLGNAARVDLTQRLDARGNVRVVTAAEDAEAVLHAKLSSREHEVILDLSLDNQDDGFTFWHETMRGPAATLPQIIARAANAIEAAFSPEAKPTHEGASFPSAEVARLFLEGRAEYRAFWDVHLKKSVELFEQALALAPDHPLIVAWCSTAQSRHRFFDESEAAKDRGHELARRAVDLAPQLAEARVALASSHIQDMRVTEAVAHFIEALRIAPGQLELKAIFARIIYECGAMEPALALAESTFAADPTFTEPLETLIRNHALHARLDLAERELERVPFTRTDFVQVAFTRYCAWVRDRDRFEAHYARIDLAELDPLGARMLAALKGAFGAGDVPLLDDVPGATLRRRTFFHQIRAEVLAFKGDTARALEAIEKSSELGMFDLPWLGCPLFDPMRGMLRFETVWHTVHERAMAVLLEIERCLSS